jgi:hypothetical protein
LLNIIKCYTTNYYSLIGDEKLNTFNFIVDAAIAAGDQIPGLENPTYLEAFGILNFSIPE